MQFQELLPNSYFSKRKLIEDGLMIVLHDGRPEILYIYYRQNLSEKFAEIQKLQGISFSSQLGVSQNGKYLIHSKWKFYEFNYSIKQFQYKQTIIQHSYGSWSYPKISNNGNIVTFKSDQGIQIFTKSEYTTFSRVYSLNEYDKLDNERNYVNFQYSPIIYTFLIPDRKSYTIIGQLNITDSNNTTYKQITQVPKRILEFSKNMRWLLVQNGEDNYSMGDYREINLKQCWIIICWVEISSMTPKRVLTISRLASKVKEALFFIIKELSVRIPYSTGKTKGNGCECLLNIQWDPNVQNCTTEVIIDRYLFLGKDARYWMCMCLIGYQRNQQYQICQILSCQGKEHVKYEYDQFVCECEEGYVWQQNYKSCVIDSK